MKDPKVSELIKWLDAEAVSNPLPSHRAYLLDLSQALRRAVQSYQFCQKVDVLIEPDRRN